MNRQVWAKNALFLGLSSVGLASLAVFLMASDRVPETETFRPNSSRQLEIAETAAGVDEAFEKEWAIEGVAELANSGRVGAQVAAPDS